jgi:hypothetical protein
MTKLGPIGAGTGGSIGTSGEGRRTGGRSGRICGSSMRSSPGRICSRPPPMGGWALAVSATKT